jgi:regulatory protein
VLDNRIRRAAMRDADFQNDTKLQVQLRLDIEEIIDQHRKTGAINDAAYAEVKARSLRRTGRSKRMIEQKLKIKGIDNQLIKKVLQPEDGEEDSEQSEREAAQILAKRKKLGPYRLTKSIKKTDAEMYRKDLATLARAGFTHKIARHILGGQGEEVEDF